MFDPAHDGGLSSSVAHFAANALASSTIEQYLRNAWEFHDFMRANGMFCQQLGVPVPSDLDLCYYVTWRHGLGDSAATPRSEVSAIGWHFKEHLDREVTKEDGRLKPKLGRVLRGVQRMSASTKRTRRPVTVPILNEFLDALGAACPDLCAPDQILYSAAMSIAVYGLLRASEYTAKGTKQFVAGTTLLGQDVTFDLGPDGQPTAARLHIRAAKEDRLRDSQDIVIHAVAGPRCPVKLLWRAARVRTGGPSEPFFGLADGSYLTRDRVTRRLRQAAEQAGYAPGEWASHSFRAGGACSLAASSGMSSELLSICGRWKSNAKELCLHHLPPSVLRDCHARMARLTSRDITASSIAAYDGRFD